MNFIGTDYHSFLQKNLKKYNYISNQDGFNMSFIPINEKEFLFCIRCLGTIPAYFGEKIIPGNYSINKNFIKMKLKKQNKEKEISLIDFGENFFWGSWTKNIIDNSIFFVGEIDKKNSKYKIIPNIKIKPYVINNHPVIINNKKSDIFFYSDIRLFKYEDKILCYDGFISGIYEIKVNNNTIYTSFDITTDKFYSEYIFYHKTSLCNNIRNYDKNWSYVKKIKVNNIDHLLFLNWFKEGKLLVTYLPYLKKIKDKCINKFIITMKKDKIDGLGNDNTGMYSFGVPLLKYKCDDEYCGIGMGHIKLIKQKHYKNNAINEFLDKIKDLKSKHNNLVLHLSYHYLTYFFILKKNGDNYKFLMSDAYLFINTDKEYIFTINYPMGINMVNEKIIVSMGMGDYYNALLSFKLDTILSVCKHDLENLDLSQYKYKIVNKNSIE